MMKLLFSISLLIFIALLGSVASSQSLDKRSAVVCSQLQSRSDTIIKNLDNKISKLTNARESALDSLKNRRLNTKEQLTEKRTEADLKILDSIEKMKEASASEEKKLIIDNYAKEVANATKDLRLSYDEAYAEYIDSVADVYKNRLNNLDSYSRQFSEAVAQTLENAQANCGAGQDNFEVRKKFVAELKQSRLSYSQNVSKARTVELKEIRQKRKLAIKAARLNFEKSMLALNAQLKEDLKN